MMEQFGQWRDVTWYNHIVASQVYSPLKELDLTWKVIWEQMMSTFIVTGMMVGVVLIIVLALPGSVDIERGIRLFLSVTLGASVYILWIAFRGGVVGQEVREIISMIFRRWKFMPV